MNARNEWNELSRDDPLLLEMVENVLAHKETAVIEDTSLRAFCAQLAHAAPAANVRFREQLKARLIESLQSQTKERGLMNAKRSLSRLIPAQRRWRIALGVFVVLIIAAAAIALYPSSRAWAQEILGRLGPFFFTNAPTLPEQALTATPEPLPTQPPEAATGEPATMQRVQVMTIEEARVLADFAILEPGYLPEGYAPFSFEVWQGEGHTVEATQTHGSGPDVLIIRQIYMTDGGKGDFEFPIGDAAVEKVAVRGQEGVWVEEANLGQHQNEDGTMTLTKWSMLLWQEGDFLFWIYTNALSKEETLKVAESFSAGH